VRYIVIPSTVTWIQSITTGFGTLNTNLTAGGTLGYNIVPPTAIDMTGGATAIVYLNGFVGTLADTTYTLSISLGGTVQSATSIWATLSNKGNKWIYYNYIDIVIFYFNNNAVSLATNG
jgi:hypothetical protein